MHREDHSKYLLYIEPPAWAKLGKPVDDGLARWMDEQLRLATQGTSSYRHGRGEGAFEAGPGHRGVHTTDCGQVSTNVDYLLPCGYITNSLAAFYLRWYRTSIPESEKKKLRLAFWSGTNRPMPKGL